MPVLMQNKPVLSCFCPARCRVLHCRAESPRETQITQIKKPVVSPGGTGSSSNHQIQDLSAEVIAKSKEICVQRPELAAELRQILCVWLSPLVDRPSAGLIPAALLITLPQLRTKR